LSIGGAGKIVDWLVVMRRLPADRMLDQLISRKSFDPRQLCRLAERLARFYAGQQSSAIRPEAYVARFTREQVSNRVMLAKIDGERLAGYSPLLDRLDAALTSNRPLLEDRVRSGCIVDGHGDLRPEHICFTDPIVIFDCLEFNDALRQVDPVDELAFLGLECAMLGASSVGPKLIESVSAQLRQTVPKQLVAFYTAFRALLRARLSLAHLADPIVREPEKWRPQADRYAAIAGSALAELSV
jgi:aminoglycoside phosphotransferase family enzyme